MPFGLIVKLFVENEFETSTNARIAPSNGNAGNEIENAAVVVSHLTKSFAAATYAGDVDSLIGVGVNPLPAQTIFEPLYVNTVLAVVGEAINPVVLTAV